MATVISDPSHQTKEQWLRFRAPGPGGAAGDEDVVVVSGYVFYKEGVLKGDNDSDNVPDDYVCRFFVGPKWLRLTDVSPIVTPSFFSHFDSDDANATGYGVEDCKWLIGAPNNPDDRIRLVVDLHVRGGPDMSVRGLAYQLVARGSLKAGQDAGFGDTTPGVD